MRDSQGTCRSEKRKEHMVYKIPAVYKVPEAQVLGFREWSAIFSDGERIIVDRKYHLKGAPGGRSRREERIRGQECSSHADLRESGGRPGC